MLNLEKVPNLEKRLNLEKGSNLEKGPILVKREEVLWMQSKRLRIQSNGFRIHLKRRGM